MAIIKNMMNLIRNINKSIKKYSFIIVLFLLALLCSGCQDELQYTIICQSNGGSSVASFQTDGTSLNGLVNPNREGYTFAGWFFDNDTFEYEVTEEALALDPIQADITIFACWTPLSSTLTLEVNGGIPINPIQANCGDAIILPIPVKEDFIFIAWYYDAELINLAEFITFPSQNITLYAKWIPENRTISFDSQGGNEVEVITLPIGSAIESAPEPTREGYTFEGWFEEEGEVTYQFTTMPNTNLTLHAHWTSNLIMLNFESNGGSTVDSYQLDCGVDIDMPLEPIREGYSFGGWYSDSTLQQVFVFDKMPTASTTIYAKWNLDPTLGAGSAEVMRSIAYAYFFQGVQLQYDQGSGRRMVLASPEDATSDHYLFMDCSSFVYSLYQYAFGINLTPTSSVTNASTNTYMNYARLNQGTSNEVIYYIENANYTTVSARSALLSTVRASLQSGDLVVIRRDNDSSGHVMMYVGDNMFIHSTGSDYNYTANAERLESAGTVLELDANELFVNTASSRYLFKSNVNKICVLRPMNRNNIAFTPQAISRYHLDGLMVEKSASTPNLASVTLGEEVTYTITLTNRGKQTIPYCEVTDQVEDNATLLSCNDEGEIIGNQVKFALDNLAPSSTTTLQYTIKVTEDTSVKGTILTSDDAMLENIPINPMYHTVLQYDDDELQSLMQLIYQKIDSTSYTSSIDLLKAIYSEFAGAMGTTSPLDDYTTLTPIYNSQMSVSLLYGGKAYNQNSQYNRDERVRYLFATHFTIGDILFLYNGSTFKTFIYNGARFVYLDVAATLVKQYATVQEIKTLLESAQGYQDYKIVRPIMIM